MFINKRLIRLVGFFLLIVLIICASFNFSSLLIRTKSKYIKKITPKIEHESKLKQLESNKIGKFPLSQELMKNYYQTVKLTSFIDPYRFIQNPKWKQKEASICEDLKYENIFQVSGQKYLDADLKVFLEELKTHTEFSYVIKLAKEKFKPTIPENKQWFRFGGSSIWLPQYNCHYMVSRVLYTPSGIANKAFVSFLYIQLFDINWNELPRSTALEIPYEEIIEHDTYKESHLKFKTESFPQILSIPFDYEMKVDNNKYYYGPEDPRIILRHNPLGFDEPLIVFNMKDLKLIKRTMHLYLPFSKRLSLFKKRNEPYAKIEKNWTPFISLHKPNELNFIYSIVPLEVLVCNIDDAICDFLQKPIKKDYNYVGPLRGGSQLIPLPSESLPTLKSILPTNRQIYIGWARAHLNKCGCGESMYRPNLIILIEDYNVKTKQFYYKLGDVSEYFDFNANIPPWIIPKLDADGQLVENENETPPSQCEGRNVLIPNSIAYWDINSIEQNGQSYVTKQQMQELSIDKNTKINDFMGVTLSAADKDVSIIHIKGLLNYILKLPMLFDEDTVITSDKYFQLKGYEWNNKCAMIASKQYCEAYAIKHGVVFEQEST